MTVLALLGGGLVLLLALAALSAWGGVALAEGVLRRLTGRGLPPRGRAWSRALLVLVLLPALPLTACEQLQLRAYRQAIPAAIGLDGVVDHAEQTSFREGCGGVIFRLAPETVAALQARGAAALEGAVLGRDGDPYHRYEAWRPTPAPDTVLRGAMCMDGMPEPLWTDIHRAAGQGGGFHTQGHEQDLLLLPALGVLVFTFVG